MEIMNIWMSQRKLRNLKQLNLMIENIELLPKIIISRCEDNEYQLMDGHHRLAVHFLSGKKYLNKYEYVLLEQKQCRPRFGKIDRLISKYINEITL